MISFDYTPRGSWIETIDTRAQIISYFCLTTSVLVVADWRVLAVLCAMTVAIALSARLVWRKTRLAWWWLLLFVGIWSVSDLAFKHCLVCAVTPTLKLLTVFLATLVLVYTIDPRTYGSVFVLRGLRAPDMVASSTNMMMRYVPTLMRDFEGTMDAQKARGLELEKPKGGFLVRLHRFLPLLIPVFVRNFLDALDMVHAMDLRGFAGPKRRTWLRQLHWRTRDSVVSITGLGLLATCMAFAFLTRQ